MKTPRSPLVLPPAPKKGDPEYIRRRDCDDRFDDHHPDYDEIYDRFDHPDPDVNDERARAAKLTPAALDDDDEDEDDDDGDDEADATDIDPAELAQMVVTVTEGLTAKWAARTPDEDEDGDDAPDYTTEARSVIRDKAIKRIRAGRVKAKAEADAAKAEAEREADPEQKRIKDIQKRAYDAHEARLNGTAPPEIQYGPVADSALILLTMGRVVVIPEWVPGAVHARMVATEQKQQAGGITSNLHIVYSQFLYWAYQADQEKGDYVFNPHPEGDTDFGGVRGRMFLRVRRAALKRLLGPTKEGRFKLRRALDKLVEIGLVAWAHQNKDGKPVLDEQGNQKLNKKYIRIVHDNVADNVAKFCAENADRLAKSKQRNGRRAKKQAPPEHKAPPEQYAPENAPEGE